MPWTILKIWNDGQLRAVEEVLGTVDQFIIDRSIMEKVKTYQRNLAVAFYDYIKAYDKEHHDWMLRVYTWIGIPRNAIALLSQLTRKWKTKIEIWKDSEKRVIDQNHVWFFSRRQLLTCWFLLI